MIHVNKTSCLWGKNPKQKQWNKERNKNITKTHQKKKKKEIEIKIQSNTTSGEKRGFHDENRKRLRFISRS